MQGYSEISSKNGTHVEGNKNKHILSWNIFLKMARVSFGMKIKYEKPVSKI